MGNAGDPPHFEGLERRTLCSVGFISAPAISVGLAGSVVADFNGDGHQDIAGYDVTFIIRLNNGDGTFAPGFSPFSPPHQFFGEPTVAADFNGDGHIDLLAGQDNVLWNNGDGTFAPPESVGFTGTSHGIVAVDYNHDGKADLVYGLAGGVQVFTGTGSGFSPGPVFAIGFGNQLIGVSSSLADGLPTVIGLYDGGAPPVNGERPFRTVLLQSDGSLSPGSTTSVALATRGPSHDWTPLFVDMNDDHVADLVWSAPAGIMIARGTEAGLMQPPMLVPGAGSAQQIVGAGDLNGDGTADLVLAQQDNIEISHLYWMAGGHDGTFALPANSALAASNTMTSWLVAIADFSGDGQNDIMISGGGTPSTRVSFAAQGPEIASVAGPSQPVLPPAALPIHLTGIVGHGGGAVATLVVVFDQNDDGIMEFSDPQIASVSVTGPEMTVLTTRYVSGHNHYFAWVLDTSGIRSDTVGSDIDVWFRVFYPEGWRNDTTINEYVPLVNPNDTEASYRIIARYETGERDQTIAEGILAPHSRGGVTISERDHPASALVRLNTGYALDVYSDQPIGATLSHYDNFGGGVAGGTATGEAFASDARTSWALADVSTREFDFLVLFNPLDRDAAVTLDFRDAMGDDFTVVQNVAALRRGGLSVRDLGLPANNDYSVTISSDSPIAAALSRYTGAGAGFTSSAQPLSQNTPFNAVAPLIEFRTGVTNRVVLYNNNDGDTDVTIVSRYQSATVIARTQVFHMAARERLFVDPDIGAPPSATRATLVISGAPNVAAQVESIDALRGDSVSTSVGVTTANTWAFADGFLDRNTAGTVGFETISIYNPAVTAQTATVRYLFTDGFSITRTVQVLAGSAAHIDLHLDQELTSHAALNFFSTIVTGDSPLIASMTHWDLFQGGGWETLGTPIGTTGTLG